MSESTLNTRLLEYLQTLQLPASRETFDLSLPAEELPQAVRLASGPGGPAIVAIPSTVALCGPHQYLDFAKPFRGIRDLFALPVPGFVKGERLPASVDAAVTLAAGEVQRCVNDGVVLVGYSSGGTLAYAIARHLQESSVSVAAVALIDAYPFAAVNADTARTQALLRKMFEDSELRRFLNATRLSAMAWYTKLFVDWELSEVAAPTLLVQPEQPMPGMPTTAEWRSSWPYPHDLARVSGDHWTMMTEHAEATAWAIENWLPASTTSGVPA